MNYPDHVDIIEAQQFVQDIDFLEIETVRKIQDWNTATYNDSSLNSWIAVFWVIEDGIESLRAFEKIIRRYHALLKE